MMHTYVFIDGSNLYFRLKLILKNAGQWRDLLLFNVAPFAQWVSRGHELVSVRYYIGAIERTSDPKSETLYANQQKFFAKLQSQNVEIITGKIIQHSDSSFHEKGVDVGIAVEMIRFARNEKYDIAYLISSDTDLIPAIQEVRSFNKKVVYVGAKLQRSVGLIRTADQTTLFDFNDIEKFFE